MTTQQTSTKILENGTYVTFKDEFTGFDHFGRIIGTEYAHGRNYIVETQSFGQFYISEDHIMDVDEQLKPSENRDDAANQTMAAEMELYLKRKRWFVFAEEIDALEKLDHEMETEVAWLYGLIAGGPV